MAEHYEEWLQRGIGMLEPIDFDVNDYHRRCEQVADRHLRTASPEFLEWLRDQEFYEDTLATLIAGIANTTPGAEEPQRFEVARGVVKSIAEDWQQAVIGNRFLANEVRREN
jgi:hypothetical protein